MATYSDDLNKRADDLLDEENKNYRQEKFEKEMSVLLKELAATGADLREVQLQIKHLISEHLGEEVEIPYEVTEEKLADPQQLGDLDALEEMTKYYTELYEQSYDLSKSARKHRDRKYNGVISKSYLKAYDYTSKMRSKVSSFYNKYQDLIEAVQEAEAEEPEVVEAEVVEETPEVTETKPTPVEKKKSHKPFPHKPGFLDGIDPAYYESIFKLIKDTVVIGSKFKYNTLDYLEYELMNADYNKLEELGIPVDEPGKAAMVRIICLALVKESKEIRKDQWLTSKNPRKQGEFEGRKHTAEEAMIDRNSRLILKLNIDPEIAAEYGLVTNLEDLRKVNGVTETEKKIVTSVKDDPIFVDFYDKFKTIYKLGSPTTESKHVLYNVYEDLQNETNSFGLTGESLKAAKILVEQTIKARRNAWKVGKENSKNNIEELQKDLGL